MPPKPDLTHPFRLRDGGILPLHHTCVFPHPYRVGIQPPGLNIAKAPLGRGALAGLAIQRVLLREVDSEVGFAEKPCNLSQG